MKYIHKNTHVWRYSYNIKLHVIQFTLKPTNKIVKQQENNKSRNTDTNYIATKILTRKTLKTLLHNLHFYQKLELPGITLKSFLEKKRKK